jgi:hypothetical protein
MTDHTFIIGFCTCKSIWLLTEFYVVINKTDKKLITCLLIFLFSIGNCHFNDIWDFVDWIHFIGIAASAILLFVVFVLNAFYFILFKYLNSHHNLSIRPKKNICVFTVTCQKNLGSVGQDYFFYFFRITIFVV